MGDSSPISIQVTEIMVATYFFNFDIQPRSAPRNGTLTFFGWLSLNPNGASSDVRVAGETVELQIYDPSDGQWKGTGATAVTQGPLFQFGPAGYFEGTVTLDPAIMYAGTWSFRMHYNGNAAKGLEGCEKNASSPIGVALTDGIIPNVGLVALGVLVVGGIVGAAYFLTK